MNATLPGEETICYIIQPQSKGALMLCVMDRRNEQFHSFEISLANASRLAAECATAINVAIGGADHKAALEAILKSRTQ